LDGLVRGVFDGRGVQLLEVAVSEKRKRQLTQAELRAAGVTPGLMVTRYTPDGKRAEIRRLTPERTNGSTFSPRLTEPSDFTTDDEGSEE
jgi:hypothetical protein